MSIYYVYLVYLVLCLHTVLRTYLHVKSVSIYVASSGCFSHHSQNQVVPLQGNGFPCRRFPIERAARRGAWAGGAGAVRATAAAVGPGSARRGAWGAHIGWATAAAVGPGGEREEEVGGIKYYQR